jgi:predicted phosphate transport protein (TIGR00153 family)
VRLIGFGRDQTFFTLLEQQGDVALLASKELHALTQDYSQLQSHVVRMDEIEHNGDDLIHQLGQKVDTSFVTPLDKEDLHAISTALDDITDSIEETVGTLAMYRLPALRPDVAPLTTLLIQTMEATREIVGCLRNISGREALQPLVIRINQLENEGDDLYRKAVSDLFHAPDRDPFQFIAWKEIYDRIENSIDKCEYVANTIEGMVVKYA